MNASEAFEARDPATDPGRLVELAALDASPGVREGVAGNPSAPVEAIMLLATDPEFRVRFHVAKNTSAPVEVLAALAGDEDSNVRRATAGNPLTPARMLTELAGDDDVGVRSAVAENPSTPIEARRRLAGDPDRSVRQLMAENPSTPGDLLTALSVDEDARVRTRVAHNPNTPTDALTALAGDPNSDVRSGVAKNPSTPVEVLSAAANGSYSTMKMSMVGNPSLPVEILTQLADDSDADVRRVIAVDRGVPVELLTRLAGDPDSRVREAAARNPSIPVDVLTRLADDPDSRVHEAAAGNPSMSAEMLQEIKDRKVSDIQRALPDIGEWVFYRHVGNVYANFEFFEAEVTSPVAWDTRTWWFSFDDVDLAELITGSNYGGGDLRWIERFSDESALLPVLDEPPDWYDPPTSADDHSDTNPLLKHNWKLLVSEEATEQDLTALVDRSDSAFPGDDLVSAVVARHPSSPAGLVERLASCDHEAIRWLVTRNPGATEEAKAAAVLAGVREPAANDYRLDDLDDGDNLDRESPSEGAPFSRTFQVEMPNFLEAAWAKKALTSADFAYFLTAIERNEQFQNWLSGRNDGDESISINDVTEWFSLGLSEEEIAWLQRHFHMDEEDFYGNAWDAVWEDTE